MRFRKRFWRRFGRLWYRVRLNLTGFGENSGGGLGGLVRFTRIPEKVWEALV
jgi:hypothetical protein